MGSQLRKELELDTGQQWYAQSFSAPMLHSPCPQCPEELARTLPLFSTALLPHPCPKVYRPFLLLQPSTSCPNPGESFAGLSGFPTLTLWSLPLSSLPTLTLHTSASPGGVSKMLPWGFHCCEETP